MSDSLEMARIAYDALDEKKGENIRVIKIDEISVIADYLVIADGNNQPQVGALVDNVPEKLAENGFDTRRVEGNRNAIWVLLDYGDVIVHVFSKEDRLFYDLERIWRDGRIITREEM